MGPVGPQGPPGPQGAKGDAGTCSAQVRIFMKYKYTILLTVTR